MKNIFFATLYLFFLVAKLQSIVVDSSMVNTDANRSSNQNIVEVAQGTPNLSTFMQLAVASELMPLLEGQGPYTIFAPNNEAFAALPKGALQNLLKKENQTLLNTLLKNHIVKGSLDSLNLNTSRIRSLGGKMLNITTRGSLITVDDASIVQPDLKGTNGVIQIIDKVFFSQ